jgi:hypothetical protein
MEGQFYRSFKTDKHPHTNMAKAALNMMTRTSAKDYVRDGIHMNSVDTGWVTDEDPAEIAARKTEEHGFHPPLDIVDGRGAHRRSDLRRLQHGRARVGPVPEGLRADALVSFVAVLEQLQPALLIVLFERVARVEERLGRVGDRVRPLRLQQARVHLFERVLLGHLAHGLRVAIGARLSGRRRGRDSVHDHPRKRLGLDRFLQRFERARLRFDSVADARLLRLRRRVGMIGLCSRTISATTVTLHE